MEYSKYSNHLNEGIKIRAKNKKQRAQIKFIEVDLNATISVTTLHINNYITYQ